MRRLWAYILIALTALITVGVAFSSVMNNLSTNIDYAGGQELFFRIAEKEGSTDFVPEVLDKDGLNDLAKIFDERLAKNNISSYKVKTHGDDTISVSFKGESAADYSNMITYLTCDGSFALALHSADGSYYVEAEEFLNQGDAYIETYNSVPCIILPVNVESEGYKRVYEELKRIKKDNETQYGEKTSKEGDETETFGYYMYLFYNWDAETFKDTDFEETKKNTDSAIFNRYCMQFQLQDNEEDQYFPNSKNKLYTAINLDPDGDGVVSVPEKTVAYSNARFFVNILNAESLDYRVTFINQNPIVNGNIENLFSFSHTQTLAMNQTLIATLCAVVIVAFLLAIYFRLGAVSAGVMAVLSVFGSIGAMVLLSAEYTIFALFALILVAIASLVSSSIYLGKIKEECYRGRSLKKANSEASKKSTLPIVDINVILIVIGAFAYIFGGIAMRSFAVITVLGGLCSLLLNTLGMKGMMWLATNTTGLIGKYEYFGVESKNVPDMLKEEKQTYFGAYANSNLTKHKGKFGIVAIALLVASVTGMVVFGVKDGSFYKQNSVPEVSTVYFETSTTNPETFSPSWITTEKITDILENVYVYQNDEDKANAKPLKVTNVLIPENPYSVTGSDKVTTTYYQSVALLDRPVSEDSKAYYKFGEAEADVLEISSGENVNDLLLQALTYEGYFMDDKNVSLKATTLYKTNELNVGSIALAGGVSIAVLGIYFMLRYRLSRGLATLLVSLTTGTIAIGLFSILRLNVTSSISAISLLVIGITMMLAVIFMSREKEMIFDIRNKDNSIEARKEMMIKATGVSFSTTLIVAILALYISINFFGFGANANATQFALLWVLVVVSTVLVTSLLGPISHFLYTKLRRIGEGRPVKKAKKKKAVIKPNRSAEPEEAIFIGIND